MFWLIRSMRHFPFLLMCFSSRLSPWWGDKLLRENTHDCLLLLLRTICYHFYKLPFNFMNIFVKNKTLARSTKWKRTLHHRLFLNVASWCIILQNDIYFFRIWMRKILWINSAAAMRNINCQVMFFRLKISRICWPTLQINICCIVNQV